MGRFMKVNGKKIIFMALVFIILLMKEFILVNGDLMRCMGMESFIGKMGRSMQVYLKNKFP